MARRTQGIRTHRPVISAEATRRELRACGTALVNHFLTMHQVMAAHVHLQPAELLIMLATTTGNVQRLLRSGPQSDALRAGEPVPPELLVPMSRRAIARVTGIPTETVRRHVASMIERGVLVSTPKGVYARNRLREAWAVGAMLRLVESHVDCTEALRALQVIVPAQREVAATLEAPRPGGTPPSRSAQEPGLRPPKATAGTRRRSVG
jgi:hypothetical protein